MQKIKIKLKDLYNFIDRNDSKGIYVKTISNELTEVEDCVKKENVFINKLVFSDGHSRLVAQTHRFMDETGKEIYAKDAKTIKTVFGKLDIVYNEYVKTDNVYDIQITSPHWYCDQFGVIHHNTGKTRLKCAFTKNIIHHNNNVLFIPLEGTKEAIKERILYNFLDMSRKDLKKLNLQQMKELFHKTLSLINSKLIIEEYPEHTLSASKLRLLLKNLKEKKKFTPDLIFLDYMGLVVPNVVSKDGGSQHSNLKRASEEFHAIAKEFNLAMVSSMQFNRKGFGSSDPAMEDISESFATLFTADEVILLIQTEDMIKENRQLWKKVKTRTGNKGMTGNFHINDEKQNLYELETGQITDQQKQRNDKIISEETDAIKNAMIKADESMFERNFEFT